MSPRWNWDSPNLFAASECALPPGPKGGGAHPPAPKGVGEFQFRRWRKSLALCLLCAVRYRGVYCTSMQERCMYSTKFDMVWLNRSPIPVGRRGLFLVQMISTCLPSRRGRVGTGRGQHFVVRICFLLITLDVLCERFAANFLSWAHPFCNISLVCKSMV
jgi:hypothetical protein